MTIEELIEEKPIIWTIGKGETMEKKLELWTIYKHPKDYPDKYVARKFILDKPTSEILVGDTLEGVRNQLPLGLTCLDRHKTDDPVIVEAWL